MPQAASAHDTFWDFISLMPESMHMIMWTMSDRAIPRSYRMMEGFGVHTFRFISEQGKSTFVKFHWKPVLGVHSVAWDEAQKISGKDPDFHRRDLWEAIESGNFPEWELGVQLVDEKDEFKFDFDLLDPTKLIPEELIPVKIIGKMTLNRNPDNFFAETEQVAFHPGHLVPGIDFSNDPLLQGRLTARTPEGITNHSVPADEDPKKYQSKKKVPEVQISKALSMKNTNKKSIATRCIAFLVADGVDGTLLTAMKKAIESEGAKLKIIAPKLGTVKTSSGSAIAVDESFLQATSVVYDAVYVPAGRESITTLKKEPDALHFVNEAYKHCKTIAAPLEFLEETYIDTSKADNGLITDSSATEKTFIKAVSQHRFWEREAARKVPA
ncbi:catalase [Ostertagia ostertagi]